MFTRALALLRCAFLCPAWLIKKAIRYRQTSSANFQLNKDDSPLSISLQVVLMS